MQELHSKGLGPSWNLALCSFNFCLDDNPILQKVQWNCFFPSWTDAMCHFKFPCWVKLFSQRLQLNFSPSWIDEICFFIEFFAEKLLLHVAHWKDFFPSCTEDMCPFSSIFDTQQKVHSGHLNGCFFVIVSVFWAFPLFFSILECSIFSSHSFLISQEFGAISVSFDWLISSIFSFFTSIIENN